MLIFLAFQHSYFLLNCFNLSNEIYNTFFVHIHAKVSLDVYGCGIMTTDVEYTVWKGPVQGCLLKFPDKRLVSYLLKK